MEPIQNPPDIAKRVIAAFGGLTKMHRKLKAAGEIIPIGTIHSWGKSEYGIPRWHRKNIIRAAKKKRITLPAEFVQEEDDAA